MGGGPTTGSSTRKKEKERKKTPLKRGRKATLNGDKCRNKRAAQSKKL